MKTQSVLIVLGIALLSTSAFPESAKTDAARTSQKNDALMKKLLKIKVGSSTRADVVRLLGEPWRATNDADCHATDYGEVWEYLAEDANGAFRIHVAFGEDGKVSLVATIPQHGSTVVLAFTPAKTQHQH